MNHKYANRLNLSVISILALVTANNALAEPACELHHDKENKEWSVEVTGSAPHSIMYFQKKERLANRAQNHCLDFLKKNPCVENKIRAPGKHHGELYYSVKFSDTRFVNSETCEQTRGTAAFNALQKFHDDKCGANPEEKSVESLKKALELGR